MRSQAERTRVARIARHARVRTRVRGTAHRPRFSVYRSLAHIHAQLIDDDAGRTLLAASTLELRSTRGTKTELARQVGARLGERAVAAGITEVVFDRGGSLYHGRVKALAEGARQAGLRF